jgi:YggT family protein
MFEPLSGSPVLIIAEIINFILTVYMWIIIVTALLSWVSPDPYNPIVRFLYRVTDPVLRPIRRVIGNRLGMVDLSPLIAVLCIIVLKRLLVISLIEIAGQIK